jgi:hypothetical protein
VAFAAGTNTGDGSASITFTVAVPGPGDGPYSTTVTLNPDPLRLGDDATVSISPILDVTGAPVTDTSAVNIEVLGPDGLARGRCYDIVSPCVFHSGWLGLQDRENTAGVYEAVVWYYPPPHNYELRIATQPFLVLPALLPTTTALSTPAPLTGSGGTLFATVTPTSSNPLIPTGTVSFTDGTTPLCGGPVDHPAETPDGKGVVYDCRLDAVTPGPHHYSATYSGDDHFAGSAGALDSMVPPAAVATSITLASAPNPAPAGQQVTFTVSVGPAGTTTLTGTVTFTDGSTPLAVEPLASDGTAAYTTDTLPVGPHQITATYSGDGSHTGASSSALTESITPPPTAPLAITTTGSLPGGTVGSQYSATLTASGGTSPYQWDLAPGSALPTGLTLHSDGRIDGTPTAASTGVVTVQVTDSARPAQASLARLNLAVAAAPTSTSLSSSADPALRGQPITFTARVTAPAGAPVPAGRVTFSDGATSRATVKLNEDGVATYTTRSLAVGSHPLTATYAGDAADLGSTSAPLPEVVQRVTAAALAAQATTDVQASHAYARLTPARRRAVLAQMNRTTQPLAVLSGRSRAAQKAALIRAFDSAVRVAERRRYLTPAQAAALIDEAATL